MAPKIEKISVPEVKVPGEFKPGGLGGSVKPDFVRITEVKPTDSGVTSFSPGAQIMQLTPDLQSGPTIQSAPAVRYFKTGAITPRDVLPEAPLGTTEFFALPGARGFFDLVEFRTLFIPSEEVLQKNASQERFPSPQPEKVEALRSQIKETLSRNSDWSQAMTRSDFSSLGVSLNGATALDNLSFEQLLILQALLRIDAPRAGEKGVPGRFLWKLKESGLLLDLMAFSPEAQRAFASLANVSSERGQGYSFAERVLFDYLRFKNSGASTASSPLFEKITDPTIQKNRNRLELALESYYWMEVAGVEGRRQLLNGITSSFFDYYQNQWTDVKGPSEWRGNIDEAIRIGHQARENAWRPFFGEALVFADHFLGEFSYTSGGGRKKARLEPDAYRRDNWIEEYKSTYLGGAPALFSFSTMTNEISFRNQVEKYGEAVRKEKIEGAVYRITASDIDPAVIDFIRENIPNVQVFRYDSIADTQGTLLLDQAKNPKTFNPQVWKESLTRAQTQGNPYFIEDGKLRTYLKPQGTICTVRAEEIKQELLLYTETLSAPSHGRLMDRARTQIQWLVELYDGLDGAGQVRFERDLKGWIREVDKGLLRLDSEEAQIKFIVEQIDKVARWVIARERPVVEEVSLSGPIYGTVLDEIPGRFKIYHRGEFGKDGPSQRLMVRKGMRIYLDSLSPREVTESYSGEAGQNGSASKKKNSPPSPHTQVLGLEAEMNLETNPHFVKRQDGNGHIYFEATQDVLLNNRGGSKDFEMKYSGENPLLDLYGVGGRR